MLHSGKCALPFALAAGVTFSAVAQAPPNDRESILVWSSRDDILYERPEFTPPVKTEVSPPAVSQTAPQSHTNRLLICEPGFRKDLLDGRAPASARKDQEAEIATRFGR